jgi:hypothetical protein
MDALAGEPANWLGSLAAVAEVPRIQNDRRNRLSHHKLGGTGFQAPQYSAAAKRVSWICCGFR